MWDVLKQKLHLIYLSMIDLLRDIGLNQKIERMLCEVFYEDSMQLFSSKCNSL